MYHGDYQTKHFNKRPGLILGFHGTDRSVVEKVVMQIDQLRASNNSWDWIGHGIYFWEYSASRAMEFAQMSSRRKHSSIKRPAVIGAVLDLGYCLDLLDYGNLAMLKNVYDVVSSEQIILPRNRAMSGKTGDLLFRDLDCRVLERLHEFNLQNNEPPFDSVKAVFWEGPLLYPNAGFREKNHIQICVRNPDCIKGFFIPKI